ncbi:MAG: GNAT family N-acetyltransferase [bacterium]|nr:GNAT family N-acetyltransferase [bacterium]
MIQKDTSYIKFIEELSFNAWPSYKSELYDDWLLGYSDFYTHRTNCVHVIGSSRLPIDKKIRYCEEEYKRLNTPCIFKINPIFTEGLDHMLLKRGYVKEHITDTYCCNLSDIQVTSNPHYEVIVEDRLTKNWIMNLFHLNRTTNENHLTIVPKMYEAIPRDIISACIIDHGNTIATGLGILERDHIGIYAIYVDEHYRGQQLAKSIVSSLLLRAKEQGIHHAYLQVVDDNLIAKRVYHSLGFRALYTYWFRVKKE